MRVFDRRFKVGREEQVFKVRVLVERLFNPFEEDGANDAAAAPKERDATQVERPAELFSDGAKLGEPLRVTADFRRVKRLFDLVNELGAVAGVTDVRRAGKNAARGDAFGFERRNRPSVNRFRNERTRDAEVERVLAHPLPGALGARRVEDNVDEAVFRFRIDDGENVAGDLDEVTVEFFAVPLAEDFGEFFVRRADGVFENPIRVADELHIAVFDAVVNHFNVMARAAVSDPIATRNVVVRADFRRNRLENRLNERPSLRVAAGHQARALASAFFAAGDAASDEADTAFGEEFNAAFGVFEVRVPAVDGDVARLEMRQKRVEDGVDRGDPGKGRFRAPEPGLSR